MIGLHDAMRGAVLKLAFILAGVSYMTLLLRRYASGYPSGRLRVDFHKPRESAESLSMWLRLHALDAGVKAARSALDVLYEASADVGGWALGRYTERLQGRHR